MSTTKKAVAKKAAPATSEEMADEATRPKKPKGSPTVVPFAALRNVRRGQFMTAFQDIAAQEHALTGGVDAMNPTEAVAVFTALGHLEEGLLVVAADPDEMDAWLGKVTNDPDQILELFFWYADRFQVGEAKASST